MLKDIYEELKNLDGKELYERAGDLCSAYEAISETLGFSFNFRDEEAIDERDEERSCWFCFKEEEIQEFAKKNGCKDDFTKVEDIDYLEGEEKEEFEEALYKYYDTYMLEIDCYILNKYKDKLMDFFETWLKDKEDGINISLLRRIDKVR